MHIPDGMLTGPVIVPTFVVVAGACGLAVRRANETLGEKQVPLLGTVAAFVFAAQMLYFPIGGGTSGHFLGAVLAAVLLGPLNAVLIMSLVLVIQSFVFQDGGITALGANIFNMGIVGGIGGYYVFRLLKPFLPRNRKAFLAAIGVSAWVSVIFAALSCSLELAVSGTALINIVLPAMIGWHILIGIGEAIITCTVISIVLTVRPDLVGEWGKWAKLKEQKA